MPLNRTSKTKKQLSAENDELRARLDEAEKRLNAIRGGQAGAPVVSGRDNSERERMEIALQEQRDFMQQVINTMGQGLTVTNREGRFELVNPAFARLLGCTMDELIGKQPADVTLPEDNAILEKGREQRLRGETSSYENRLVRADGNLITVLVTGTPRYIDGNIAGSISVVTDLTAIRRAEQERREAEERFNSAFRSSQIGIHIFRLADDRSLDANQAYLNTVGYSREELLGHTAAELNLLVHPEQRPVWLKTFREKGLVSNIETSIRNKSGEIRHTLFSMGMIEMNGEAAAMVLNVDITRRKRAEQALSESEARYRTLFENMQEGFSLNEIITDANGRPVDFRILDANSAYERNSGLKPAEIIGKTILEIMPQVDPRQIEQYGRVALTGEPLSFEYYSKAFNRHLRVRVFSPQPGRFATIFEDISEYQKAEAAVRAGEEKYRLLFENMSQGVVYYDSAGKMTAANLSAERILGLSHEQLMGQAFISPNWKIFKQDGSELANEEHPIAVALRTGCPVEGFVLQLDAPKRSAQIWISTSAIPLSHPGEERPYQVYSIFDDITGRKQAEELLRENDEKFRAIFNTSPDAIGLFDASANTILMNPATAKIFGFENPAEMVGNNALESFLPEDREKALGMIQQVQVSGQVRNAGFTLLKKDGSSFDAEISCSALYELDGKLKGIVTITRDITKRKKAEAALRRSEDRLREVLENSLDASYKRNLKTNDYDYLSPVFDRLSGYSQEELKNMPIETVLNLINPVDQAEVDRVIELSMSEASGLAYEVEYRFRHKNGEDRWFRDRFIFLRDADGQPLARIGSVADITARKRAQDALREAHAELEQRVLERTADLQAANSGLEKASRAKDEFMAVMSHELRTPLTGILGLSQVLQFNTYGEMNARQATAVQNIEKSGQHLLELINQILDFSKLQSGKVELQKILCSLDSICRASLRMVEPLSVKKNQDVSFQISPDQILLQADEHRLRQVVLNLLSNAVKFTPEGGRIELKVTGIAEAGQVFISVRDTGIGIKDEDLPRLFQPFVQLDMRLSRQYEGTGLGLALVSQLVELHGGKVEVESVLGQGSRFTVILPWVI